MPGEESIRMRIGRIGSWRTLSLTKSLRQKEHEPFTQSQIESVKKGSMKGIAPLHEMRYIDQDIPLSTFYCVGQRRARGAMSFTSMPRRVYEI